MDTTINGYACVITVDDTTGMITVVFPGLYLVPDQPVNISFAPETGIDNVVAGTSAYLVALGFPPL